MLRTAVYMSSLHEQVSDKISYADCHNQCSLCFALILLQYMGEILRNPHDADHQRRGFLTMGASWGDYQVGMIAVPVKSSGAAK